MYEPFLFHYLSKDLVNIVKEYCQESTAFAHLNYGKVYLSKTQQFYDTPCSTQKMISVWGKSYSFKIVLLQSEIIIFKHLRTNGVPGDLSVHSTLSMYRAHIPHDRQQTVLAWSTEQVVLTNCDIGFFDVVTVSDLIYIILVDETGFRPQQSLHVMDPSTSLLTKTLNIQRSIIFVNGGLRQ